MTPREQAHLPGKAVFGPVSAGHVVAVTRGITTGMHVRSMAGRVSILHLAPCGAFSESVRCLTGPAWNRLLNLRQPVGPTATDWLRLPIGIGVRITRGLRIDAVPRHRLREPAVSR
jgi:hypothetical protein